MEREGLTTEDVPEVHNLHGSSENGVETGLKPPRTFAPHPINRRREPRDGPRRAA